jgi:hypothetical protein
MSIDLRFDQAISAFDSANAQDPNLEELDGEEVPHEWIDAKRVADWVLKLDPTASEALRLASRCQHIKRWESPRTDYPMNRAGYLKWRQDLKAFHAETAGNILRDAGYDEAFIRAVQDLNLKKNLPQGGDVQVLEDALCLSFLEFEYAVFLQNVPEERMVGILRKTWGKMSEEGRAQALTLSFSGEAKRLIAVALSDA